MKTHEKVRKLRENQQLTQEQMADKLHLTPSSYAKLERGETKIKIERLQQIANIFNIDISELLEDSRNILNIAIDSDIEVYGNNNLCDIAIDNLSFKKELKLKDKIIQDKDSIIASKDETIQTLKREILSLQKVIELLENKR